VSDQTKDPLEACEQVVEELKAENADLRESAESFGALAERLNLEKRSGTGSVPVTCPRCGSDLHVQPTGLTSRGNDLHCNYCGNSWHHGS
jgi:hypothetical protein